jgi:hypothetical protein
LTTTGAEGLWFLPKLSALSLEGRQVRRLIAWILRLVVKWGLLRADLVEKVYPPDVLELPEPAQIGRHRNLYPTSARLLYDLRTAMGLSQRQTAEIMGRGYHATDGKRLVADSAYVARCEKGLQPVEPEDAARLKGAWREFLLKKEGQVNE